jgi:hypothetical protein
MSGTRRAGEESLTMEQRTPSTSELERLERRMERKWYDLAMAEQRGQPAHVLERMYDAYLKALDEYVRCQRGLNTHSDRSNASRLAS